MSTWSAQGIGVSSPTRRSREQSLRFTLERTLATCKGKVCFRSSFENPDETCKGGLGT